MQHVLLSEQSQHTWRMTGRCSLWRSAIINQGSKLENSLTNCLRNAIFQSRVRPSNRTSQSKVSTRNSSHPDSAVIVGWLMNLSNFPRKSFSISSQLVIQILFHTNLWAALFSPVKFGWLVLRCVANFRNPRLVLNFCWQTRTEIQWLARRAVRRMHLEVVEQIKIYKADCACHCKHPICMENVLYPSRCYHFIHSKICLSF